MSSLQMIPRYDTKLMTEIWKNASEFLTDYKDVGIPATISDTNATTLFYLLYAKYGNSPIANYDEEQFKYKVFSVIFQYGPTWEKRLEVQNALRNLEINEIVEDGSLSELAQNYGSNTVNKTYSESSEIEDINNHAFNPGTAPAENAYSPLNYINEQNARKNENSLDGSSSDSASHEGNNELTRTLTTSKLKGYERLLDLLKSDVTGEFINKFKICFKQFVMPERTWIYVTEDEDEEE